jgi:hypothetical protein
MEHVSADGYGLGVSQESGIYVYISWHSLSLELRLVTRFASSSQQQLTLLDDYDAIDDVEQIPHQRAATAAIGVHFDDLAGWSVLQNLKTS